MVQKEIQKLKIPRDVVSVVAAISGNKCKVNIDGTDYWVKDGIGLDLSVGSQVWVRIPNRNMSDIYICARK